MTGLLRDDYGTPLLAETGQPLRVEYVPITAGNGPPFFVVEVTAFRPADGTLTLAPGWNGTAWNTLSLTPTPLEATTTIRGSDVGYRSLASDADGVRVYPAIVTEAFSIDRQVPLDPGDNATAQAWGQITLANDDGRFDAIATAWNGDRRAVSIYRGTKTWDDTRGIFLDPSYGDLVPVFTGLGMPWFLGDTDLEIPIQDASYWTDAPLQSSQYQGTGTYQGGADLTGKRPPKARGGTSSHPICNVTPVLLDATNLIYQYTDGPGTVVNLYEGAAKVFTADGDTTDLYAGTPPASGHYRTNNARGLFQLGREAVKAITCDVTGAFPVAGAVSIAAQIARWLLAEDLELPSAYLDTTSFTDAGTDFPYVAGIYFGLDEDVTGATAVSRVLAAFGARLIAGRTGTLSCFVLRALAGTETPVLKLDPTNIVTLTPIALPTTLDPPPYRARVAYQHNYTVQATDQSAIDASATDAQLSFVAVADRYASWASNTIALRYARPNDIAPFGGALLIEADAQDVADATGALWGTRRRLYDAVVPVTVGVALDMGDVVQVTFPMDDLRSGRLGQVVREAFRSGDDTLTLRILV